MLCLRFDLDYVPWDTANAEKYGHGEPAMVLKLLEFARQKGLKFHFFISNRALRTFPTTADAILGEGHDLDWLTHYPDDPELYEEAKKLFALAGHRIVGMATDLAWPKGTYPAWSWDLSFLTGPEGPHPEHLKFFTETGRADVEVLPLGFSSESILGTSHISEVTPDGVATVVARPQIMAKVDPDLKQFGKLIQFITMGSIRVRTLRDAVLFLKGEGAERN